MTAPGQAIADASTNGSHSLVIWESADLVSWDGPRLVDVAPQDAGCAWSPQAIYDPDSKDYMVFWSSTTHGDRTPLQRIWSCRTKDFKNFSPAEVYLDRKGGAMDLNIVQDGTKFFRIFKDMGLNRLVMETSASIAGPWDPVPDFSLSQTPGVNSPECFALKPEPPENKKTWCLFVNSYLETPGGFRPFLSEDLSSGNFTEAEGFSFPFIFRNGSVLPISHAEYSRIENAFGSN
jgi:hypothetical protein